MSLFISKVSLILTWSTNCVISSNAAAYQPATFTITDTKRHVSAPTLLTQEKVELLQ